MIPHIANFYWNRETPLSYLRYLTLVTFRHHHPQWTMRLWTSRSNTAARWGGPERQDFMATSETDYMPVVHSLGVDVLNLPEDHGDIAPNYISDIARWQTIVGGGWFFDMDQIIVRPFNELCFADFVTGAGNPGVIYCGVVGASPLSRVPEIMLSAVTSKITAGTDSYCEAGNWLLRAMMSTPEFRRDTDQERHNTTPSRYFYPVADSGDVWKIYDGSIIIPRGEDNYAMHWFGGHPLSQKFNAIYTEKYARTSNDTISRYLRMEGIG